MPEDEEVNCRFKYLLNPVKDLAKNFSLDLQKDLNEYLKEINELDDGCDVELDLNDVVKFDFGEAGIVVKGSANIYGRKVEYVYDQMSHFNSNIASRRHRNRADDYADGNDDGEPEQRKKRRAQAHDNDPLSFPKMKKSFSPYFAENPNLTKKNAYKLYAGADLMVARIRNRKTLYLMPDVLRPIPDHEKIDLVFYGVWARAFEPIGKPEDFWTFSYTTVEQERRWITDMKQEQYPKHGVKYGGCMGCTDADCPDANYLKPVLQFGPKMAGRPCRILLKTIFLDLAGFMTVSRDLLMDPWYCYDDLRPRSEIWDSEVRSIRTKRQHQIDLIQFAIENVLDEKNFTAAVTRRGRLTGLTGYGGSQTLSQQTGSQSGSQDPSDHLEIGGSRFPGRVSSRLEMARKSLLGAGRTTQRFSLKVVPDQELGPDHMDDDGYAGGFDDDADTFDPFSVRPLQQETGRKTRSASVATSTANLEPWSEEACKDQRRSIPLRDPYSWKPALVRGGNQLQMMAPRTIPVNKRCDDPVKRSKKARQELLSMRMGERFQNFNWMISSGTAPPPTNENWLSIATANMRRLCKVLLKARRAAQRKVSVRNRGTVRTRSQTIGLASEQSKEAASNEGEAQPDPWAAFEDDGAAGFDSYEELGLPQQTNEDDPNTQPMGDQPRFMDLNRDDIRCDLIDLKPEPLPFSQERDMTGYSSRTLTTALDHVLCHPEMNVTDRLNTFLQHAYVADDARSQLEREVQEWEDTIMPQLQRELTMKKFDVHEYGSESIQCFNSIGQSLYFEDLCRGKEMYEVSRIFLSCLMMANTNNVELNYDPKNEAHPLQITLLNADRPHERLDNANAL